jgi:hypothetical protein
MIRIAYLVNQYPMVSHSFIRREILALESRGFEVQRIALRGWDDALADAEDREERRRTRSAAPRTASRFTGRRSSTRRAASASPKKCAARSSWW